MPLQHHRSEKHIDALPVAPGLLGAAGTSRFTIGDYEVIALGDGHLDLAPSHFPEADRETAVRLTAAAGLPPGPVETAVNAFAIRTGNRVMLVDAGTGHVRGPRLGHAVEALAAAGIAPNEVDAVLMTHLHVDHAAGLRDARGEATFPKAELLVPEAEAAFWLDPGLPSRAPELMQPMITNAAASLAPYKGRTTLMTPGHQVAPGVTSVPLPGHTPGHTGYLIERGGERLLIWGDIIHVAALQLRHPEWSVIFDVDRPAAAAMRRRTLDWVASDELPVAGMHIGFPGLGRIVRDGTGYVLAPEHPLG
ncbi:MBL fold metallo-hydrolase [Microvirga sp. TS319]|uniref:MBL fold metallo-hydrolase n=1 Tax=Microvirga sp. TS319 TaxID=3241165 RepID=UPI003519E0AB